MVPAYSMLVNGAFDTVAEEQFNAVIAGVGCITGSSVFLQAMQRVMIRKTRKFIFIFKDPN